MAIYAVGSINAPVAAVLESMVVMGSIGTNLGKMKHKVILRNMVRKYETILLIIYFTNGLISHDPL